MTRKSRRFKNKVSIWLCGWSILQHCTNWHEAFSDTDVTIQRMVVEDDFITVHWHLTATHTGDFMRIPASDKAVSLAGMEINRIEDGRIRETWRLSDTMTLMQQLGALDN